MGEPWGGFGNFYAATCTTFDSFPFEFHHSSSLPLPSDTVCRSPEGWSLSIQQVLTTGTLHNSHSPKSNVWASAWQACISSNDAFRDRIRSHRLTSPVSCKQSTWAFVRSGKSTGFVPTDLPPTISKILLLHRARKSWSQNRSFQPTTACLSEQGHASRFFSRNKRRGDQLE
jgi:hypothetical protein